MKRRGRPPYPDVLTPREWEVLDLVRQGFTNEMIGERLAISERTARFHVSEILSKLGLGSRWEAAAWEPPQPLLPRHRVTLRAFAWGGAMAASLVLVATLGVLIWGVWRSGSGADASAAELLSTAADKLEAAGSFRSETAINGRSTNRSRVTAFVGDDREYFRAWDVIGVRPGQTSTFPWGYVQETIRIGGTAYGRDCAARDQDCGPWTAQEVSLDIPTMPHAYEVVAKIREAHDARIVDRTDGVVHVSAPFDYAAAQDHINEFFGMEFDSFSDEDDPIVPAYMDVWIDEATGYPVRIKTRLDLAMPDDITDTLYSDFNAVVIEAPDDFIPTEAVENR